MRDDHLPRARLAPESKPKRKLPEREISYRIEPGDHRFVDRPLTDRMEVLLVAMLDGWDLASSGGPNGGASLQFGGCGHGGKAYHRHVQKALDGCMNRGFIATAKKLDGDAWYNTHYVLTDDGRAVAEDLRRAWEAL